MSLIGALILLVEDDPETRAGLQELLELEGYRVLAATTVADACTILGAQGGNVRCVLSDTNLEDGSVGHELYLQLTDCRWIVGFIAVSGEWGINSVSQALYRSHDVPVFTKPVNIDELLECIAAILSV